MTSAPFHPHRLLRSPAGRKATSDIRENFRFATCLIYTRFHLPIQRIPRILRTALLRTDLQTSLRSERKSRAIWLPTGRWRFGVDLARLSPSIHKFAHEFIPSGLSAALGHELGPNGVSAESVNDTCPYLRIEALSRILGPDSTYPEFSLRAGGRLCAVERLKLCPPISKGARERFRALGSPPRSPFFKGGCRVT